ncbi:Laccase-1 [Neonectria ditissima]|uniref:Laccase-1 n=1 Tax=Neonectria ditissima TaxID=78410 RepID=A0A0P7AXM7_9HYPO|nr:Laccase-1 [Neonectria ditissima]
MIPSFRTLLFSLLLTSVVGASYTPQGNYSGKGHPDKGHSDKDHKGKGHGGKDGSGKNHYGRTKEFEFSVTWEEHAPDGFSRHMLLVNGHSPGPVLNIDQDDWVVVNVHNYSPYNTTVHFHGIEMLGTPWSDGVPGVTQHPIEPDCSFTYKFRATQYGSYWYHAHFRGQIEDGMYGAIVINPRSGDPKPFHLISEDSHTIRAMEEAERNVVPLVITDFTHLTSDAKWDMTLAAGVEDSCYDSILFNGKGSVQCLSESEVAANLSKDQETFLGLVPGAAMTDKACIPASVLIALGGGGGDESALLPGVFSGCKETKGSVEVIEPSCDDDEWIAIDIVGAINFATGVVSIDEHDMWVYAMDGSYIEPQKVQAIVVTNGDRYSVLVKLDKAGNYKIRFNSATTLQMITGHAILSVPGEGGEDDESDPYISIVGVPLSQDVVFFNQDVARPFPPDPISETADALFHLSMKIDGSSYLWALNSSRLMPVDLDSGLPTLFHPDPYAHNNVTISTKLGTWVDLVFFASAFPQPPHPIHKHGTKMYKIGSGSGPFEWDSVEEAIKEIPDQFNLVNPPRRDAFASLPATDDVSWVVVRYHATNPGAWLLHCHINNHMLGGMMMVIQDGVDHWPEIPEEYQDDRY